MPAAQIEQADGGLHLGEGERGGFLGRELRDRGMHGREGNELVVLRRLVEEGQGHLVDRQPRSAPPARLEELREPLLQPDGDGVPALLGDEIMGELVRERVEPRVAAQQSARRGDHEPVVLAERDGPGGFDLRHGQRGNARERLRALIDFDADLGGRRHAEILGQRRVGLLQALEGVGDEERVLPRPGAQDEVRALVHLVVLHLLGGRLREPQMRLDVGGRRAPADRLLELLAGLVVFALLEQHAPGEEGGERGATVLVEQGVEPAPRAFDVPGLEVGLDPVGEIRAFLRVQGLRGEEREGQGKSYPHLTSSS